MKTLPCALFLACLATGIVLFHSVGVSAADCERPEKKPTVPVFKDGEAQVVDGFKDSD